jgi:hypothetical protein
MLGIRRACYSLIAATFLGVTAESLRAEGFNAPATRPARVIFEKEDESGMALKVSAAPFDLVAEWSKDKRFVPDRTTPPPKAEEYTFDVSERGVHKTTLAKVVWQYWDEGYNLRRYHITMGGGPRERSFKVLDGHFEGDKCFLLVKVDGEILLNMLSVKTESRPVGGFMPGELECHELNPRAYGFNPGLNNVDIETGSIRGRASDGTMVVELVDQHHGDTPLITLTFSRRWRNGLPDFAMTWQKTLPLTTK